MSNRPSSGPSSRSKKRKLVNVRKNSKSPKKINVKCFKDNTEYEIEEILNQTEEQTSDDEINDHFQANIMKLIKQTNN